MFFIIFLPKQPCNIRHHFKHVDNIGCRLLRMGTDKILYGCDMDFLWFSPFAIGLSIIRDAFSVSAIDIRPFGGRIPFSERSYFVFRVFLHGGITAFQDFLVSVSLVVAIGDKNTGIRPSGGPIHDIHIEIDAAFRCNLAELSTLMLAINHIVHIFSCHRFIQEEIGCRIAENLCIACPAMSFSGRTVGWHIGVIVLCGPSCCLDKSVEQFIAA